VGETRSTFLAHVTPITPFLGSAGEAGTPCRGQVGAWIERISDERVLRDDLGNRWLSDGEVQLTRVEVVSPRYRLLPGSWGVPVHFGATLQMYSLHGALFDDLRNWVEETFLDGDPVALGHDLGGRELRVEPPAGAGPDILGQTPLVKVKAFAKFPLRDLPVGGCRLHGALTVGLGTPSFGSHADSGNSDFQPEVTFAWALPFATQFRWTGAATGAYAGSSDLHDRVGLPVEDWVFGANTNVEFWPFARFAVALGVSWSSAYTTSSGLPMDLDSFYVNLGVLYRLSPRSDVHLLFSENPEGHIITTPGADYSDSQKESDFTLTLGWRLAF
jgi:hypothetical protein